MHQPLSLTELQALLGRAFSASALDEWMLLLACLLLAGLVSAVGSSRVDLQACKLEYSIVSPK